MFQCLHRRHWFVLVYSPTSYASAYRPLHFLLSRVEDAPALSSLHSFKAEISNEGKIVVTAPLDKVTKNNYERSSLPVEISVDATEQQNRGTVIVGGGAGAIHTVESLREVSSLLLPRKLCCGYLNSFIESI